LLEADMTKKPNCARCGEELAGIDLWLFRYATAVLPALREQCRTCRDLPVCARCGEPREAGDRYCRRCRSEYNAIHYRQGAK
jgi:hypothetical protein